MRFLNALFIAAFFLASAAGCFTQPLPAADDALPDKDADIARKLAPEELDIINAQKGYIFNHESCITDLGVVADVGVIADLDGYLYRFNVKDKSVLPPGVVCEDYFGEILAAKGSRYLHIQASETRAKRNRLIIHYLRQQMEAEADRRGFYYPPVANIEISLALYQKVLDIEETWLNALQNGVPLAKAKRVRTKSHAALIKTIADWRTELPPPDQDAPPQLSEAEDATARAGRTLKRAARIAQKLSRKTDALKWTAARKAKHETMRAAVQTWRASAEKRYETESAYLDALKRGADHGALLQSLWEARYVSYAAFAEACAAALDAEWLPPPPAFAAQSEPKPGQDWRLNASTATLEAARAAVAVWQTDWYGHWHFYLHYRIGAATLDNTFGAAKRRRAAANVWQAAVKTWQRVLADERIGVEEKRAAADAALHAKNAFRAADQPPYPKPVYPEGNLLSFIQGGDEDLIDVETVIYEIAVFKITDSWLIAMDMEDLYPPKTRLAREERTAAALEQLVAAKEWLAASLDEKADEEDMRLAQAIALSFGIELWNLYHDSVISDSERHPFAYHIAGNYPWGDNGGYTHRKRRERADAAP